MTRKPASRAKTTRTRPTSKSTTAQPRDVSTRDAPWLANKGNPWERDGEHEKFLPGAFDPGTPHVPKGRTFRLASNPDHLWEDATDLDNLRFIEPPRVRRLLEELEELAVAGRQDVTCILATGGTLAATRDAEGDLDPVLSIDELLDEAGSGIRRKMGVTGIPHRKLIDSADQEFDYLADLVIVMAWIWHNASNRLKRAFLGFVIPHGTDTIDAAGPAIAMMLGPDHPFSYGFVGAQRTRDDLYSDVPVNLRFVCDALLHLKKKGVVAGFIVGGGTSGGAYRATSAIKATDDRVDFLACPGSPQLIDVSRASTTDNINAPFEAAYHKREGYFQPLIIRGYARIHPIISKMGLDPASAWKQVVTADEPVVVFGSYAAFTANNKLFRAVQMATQQAGKLLLVINQLPGGSTDHEYKAGKELHAYAANMLFGSLVPKISLALAIYGSNYARVIDFITKRNYVGEQISWPWNADADNKQLGAPPEIYQHC